MRQAKFICISVLSSLVVHVCANSQPNSQESRQQLKEKLGPKTLSAKDFLTLENKTLSSQVLLNSKVEAERADELLKLTKAKVIPPLENFRSPFGMSPEKAADMYEDWRKSLIPDHVILIRLARTKIYEDADFKMSKKTGTEFSEIIAVIKKKRQEPFLINPGTPSLDLGVPVVSVADLWKGRLPDKFNPVGFFEVVQILNMTTGDACPGTLISPLLILTAAHCAAPDQELTVLIQKDDPTKIERCKAASKDHIYLRCTGFEALKIKKAQVARHPQYVSGEKGQDVALLVIPSKINGARFARVSLSTGFTKVTLAGYGRTDLPFASTNLTEQAFRIEVGWYNGPTLVSENLISWHVTGPNGLATGACKGDSGGPVYAGTRTGFETSGELPQIIAIVQGGLASCRDYDTHQTAMNSQVVQQWLCQELTQRQAPPCVKGQLASRLLAPELREVALVR